MKTAIFKTRGQQLKKRLIEEAGECASADDVAEILGVSRSEVTRRTVRKELLAIALRNGDAFPQWQFDGKKVHPWVPQVLTYFPTAADALAFLQARRPSLQGNCFLVVAVSGNEAAIANMLRVASRSGESDAAQT